MANETERKFLITDPGEEYFNSKSRALGEKFRIVTIHQVYLWRKTPKIQRRTRKITGSGTCSYTYTEKEKVSDMTRVEREREIDVSEFRRLYAEAQSELYKSRISFPFETKYGTRTAEIDLYPPEYGGEALSGKAVLEVEMDSEEEESRYLIPEGITVLRELTGTGEFTNTALAKPIQKQK